MNGLLSLVIFAGPNGAGKTTFANKYLARLERDYLYLNADDIARKLASQGVSDVEVNARAAKELLIQIERYIRSGRDLALETTLAGHTHINKIPGWRALGYHVTLHYLQLASADESIEWVRQRVKMGGHGVPESDLRRRFPRSWRNFEITKPLVDEWHLYDRRHNAPIESGRNSR